MGDSGTRVRTNLVTVELSPEATFALRRQLASSHVGAAVAEKLRAGGLVVLTHVEKTVLLEAARDLAGHPDTPGDVRTLRDALLEDRLRGD